MTDLTPGPAPTPSQAQCGLCRQTFSGVSLFDKHRIGGQCADPRQMTDIRQDPRGVWRGTERNGRFPVILRAVGGRTGAIA